MLHIQEWGTGDRIALLVHGLASSSSLWNRLGPELADMGYHVIAPDLPGHGKSAREPAYAFDSWVQRLHEQFPVAEVAMGHSLGGLLALALRRKLNVQKLVAIDPVLRLPKSVFLGWTRFGFGVSMAAVRFWPWTPIHEKETVAAWDMRSVKALEAPARGSLHKLDDSVLVLKPKMSYIAPRKLLSTSSGSGQVTLVPRSGHNIHRSNYDAMSSSIREFLAPRLRDAPEEEFQTLLQVAA